MDKKAATKGPLSKRTAFRKALNKWFEQSGKNYPWRATDDPWEILVSEIMLQQTTVSSVIANRRFERFLEEFPDLETISRAQEDQLLRAWEGLGYYNRVRNLQRAAAAVLSNHHGIFPKDAATLESLPGIGKYTAGAVSSFAFNEPAPIVDANIARVLARLFNYQSPIDSTAGIRQLWKWAELLLDQKHPRIFNSAIMELGQTYCSPKLPDCHSCPVRNFCHSSSPESLPLKKPRRKVVRVDEHAIFFKKDRSILLMQESGGRRKGFWRLPLRSEEEVAHLEPETKFTYSITHHRVTLYLYRSEISPTSSEIFVPLNRLDSLPIASPIRRAIEASL
jgi:A/G-specific adenine glycosylase